MDRVGQLQLLEQELVVDLDVAGLVHHLGGGVELGVDVGHRLDDLGRADQRPLLAVEELGEEPGGVVVADVVLLGPAHLHPRRRAVDRHVHVGKDALVLDVDVE